LTAELQDLYKNFQTKRTYHTTYTDLEIANMEKRQKSLLQQARGLICGERHRKLNSGAGRLRYPFNFSRQCAGAQARIQAPQKRKLCSI